MGIFKILALDGGGSKGVYTLGALAEVEALLGKQPLAQSFDLVYGTSTGAIIAALIAMGKSVREVEALYFDCIPTIMKSPFSSQRSRALEKGLRKIFGNSDFSIFQTDIGIVSTHIDYAKPMIFKSSIRQSHGMRNTFSPGFGAKVADAILASCAAFPYFNKVQVKTMNQGDPLLLDGGFVANNPTLFSIADALNAYKVPSESIRVLSVGVGIYAEPARAHEWLLNMWPFWLTRKTLECNTNTIEIIRSILFKHIKCVRVNETFAEREYATDLLENDKDKLKKLFQLGRKSYGKFENDIKELLGV